MFAMQHILGLEMADNVYFFVPNLIGYARIILGFMSFYYMQFDHVMATCCYLVSVLLDEFDGYAARMLGQSSKFGAMLDQLTDRCCTMCLLMVLGNLYHKYMFFFQFINVIDIASHWLYVHSSAISGSESHKKIDLSGNFILRHYYTNRIFLSFMCIGNELFFSMIYLCYFTPGPIIPVLSIGMFKVVCFLAAPVSFMKIGISLVHLWAASENIVGIDTADRLAAKQQ